MHGPTCIFWANLTPFSLKVLDLVEPWVTPLLTTINHTRKTAIALPDGQRFMLGVFFPHDDVSLGVTQGETDKGFRGLT